MYFDILTDALGAVNTRIEKINLKAIKLGFDPLEITNIETYDLKSKDPTTRRLKIEKRVTGDILGTIPHVDGWKVFAKIEHGEKGNIVRGGHSDDTSLHSWDADCDHCNVKRDRKTTYALADVNDNSIIKQVGSTCLNDFFKKDVSSIVAFYSMIGALENELSGSFLGIDKSPLDVIATTALIVENLGYTKASEVEKVTTKESVFSYFHPVGEVASKWVSEHPLEDRHYKSAHEILEWLENEDTTNNSFLANCKAITAYNYCGVDKFGYLSGLVGFYEAVKAKAKAEALKPEIVDAWIDGEVKERKFLDLEFIGLHIIDGHYGETYLHKFLKDGKQVNWFGSKIIFDESNEGELVRVKATIKAFEEYKGIKQTLITRVSI